MRCTKCQKLYDAHVEGTLSESLESRVREHLGECPSCSMVWQENEALRGMLRESARPAQVPDAAYFALLARRAVLLAEAGQSAAAGAERRATFPEACALFFRRMRQTSFRLAQAATLLLIGTVGGVAISQGLRANLAGQKVLPKGYELVRETQPGRPMLRPVAAVTPAASAEIQLASLPTPSPLPEGEPAERPTITKLAELAPTPPTFDPEAVVATWQNTVKLLDKLTPSEEVERLRQIQRVSRQVQPSAVLARLQDLKLQLVRTGQTDYIRDVHQIEEVFKQLAAVSRGSQATEFAHLDTYQKAEEALIQRRYDDAMRLFKTVVIQAPSSYLAARAMYQMANINFEHFHDFKNALIDYSQCLNEYPENFISETIQKQIHERVDMITQNSQSNYGPLLTFYKAESTTKPAAAIPLYCALLRQYPQSSLVRPAIEALTRIVRQASEDTSTVNQVLEALDQFQDQNPGNPCEMIAQLGLADVTGFCVRNRQQALIEYTKILEKCKDADLVEKARERMRAIEK